MPLKLNLGAGERPIVGYRNYDVAYTNGFNGKSLEEWSEEGLELQSRFVYPLDKRQYNLQYLTEHDWYDENSIDEIRAVHVLEHFSHRQVLDVLSDWIYCLKPGGVLKLAVPDFRYICTQFLRTDIGAEDRQKLQWYVMGAHSDVFDQHGSLFDRESLTNTLQYLGLQDVRDWPGDNDDCSMKECSLNLMARKPGNQSESTAYEELEKIEDFDKAGNTVTVNGVKLLGWHIFTGEVDRDQSFTRVVGDYAIDVFQYRVFQRFRSVITAPDGSKITNSFLAETQEAAFEKAEAVVDQIQAAGLALVHPDPRFAHLEIPKGDVRAVQTVPRLGFTSHMHCAYRAMFKLGIQMSISGGAFWSQGMQNAIEQALQENPKYILTLDFDTIFDENDVQTLYGLMECCPQIAALCPVQMRREVSHALMTKKDDAGNVLTQIPIETFQNDVTKIATGHFGLTMIRADVIRALPKPWFQEQADDEGEYGDGRIDADIAFWKALEALGYGTYMANRVAVGHAELVITWPDQYMRPMIQRAGDNHKDGRPSKLHSKIWR